MSSVPVSRRPHVYAFLRYFGCHWHQRVSRRNTQALTNTMIIANMRTVSLPVASIRILSREHRSNHFCSPSSNSIHRSSVFNAQRSRTISKVGLSVRASFAFWMFKIWNRWYQVCKGMRRLSLPLISLPSFSKKGSCTWYVVSKHLVVWVFYFILCYRAWRWFRQLQS